MDLMHVISDFEPVEANQLKLQAGDTVNVLDRVTTDWWWVELIGKDTFGYAPVNHLSLLTDDEKWEDDEYFSSYGELKLHSEMLNDAPRTLAYKNALETASWWIKNKVVLDVGCGTGILSLLCAQYGKPKMVYAVECSDIAVYARDTVSLNGFQDVIDVIQSKVEDIDLPQPVDLIISEWMGTLLVFEYMIESVILAREKFLKPDGIVWPSEAEVYLVPCSAKKPYHERMGIWKNVYGFDFSPYIPLAKDSLTSKPLYNHNLSAENCLSQASIVFALDISTMTVSLLESSEATFDFVISKSGTFHGFASWFKVYFSKLPHPFTPVCLSTSPDSPITHWKQDLFLIDTPLELVVGQRLKGTFQLERHKLWRRHLRIKLTYSLWNDEEIIIEETTKEYKVWR